MVKTERRNYDTEFLDRLARIETKIEAIFERIEKINGSIADYQTNKEKLNNACLKITEIEANIDDKLMPLLSNIKIKVWGLAGLIGAIMGLIGILIGKYL